MTSKEKLKAIKDYFWNDREPNYNAHQFFKDIEKDLEVLEIINKYESITFVKENGRYKIILASEKIKEEEHNVLWEWLNEK